LRATPASFWVRPGRLAAAFWPSMPASAPARHSEVTSCSQTDTDDVAPRATVAGLDVQTPVR